MKIHRFILNFNIREGRVIISDAEFVNQVKNVLKLKKGERVILGDGNSNEILGEVLDIKKDVVEINVVEEMKNNNESGINSILYCSVLKKENFELVVQKATEVGIKEIVPIITKRTVKLNLNQVRLKKIIKEAAEQSGRGIVPILHEPKVFEKALQESQGKLNLFFDSSGSKLQTNHYQLQTIGIWIGPEGGWDEKEVELARSSKFEIVSLGKITLRAETAAIVASYLISQNG